MRKLIALLAVVSPLILVTTHAFAQKSGAHFDGEPTCTVTGESLTCAGKVAGLDNQDVTVELDVTRECINRGDSSPPGQVTPTQGPIAPKSRAIKFNVTVQADCPDKVAANFTSPATINIFQDYDLVFTGQIPF